MLSFSLRPAFVSISLAMLLAIFASAPAQSQASKPEQKDSKAAAPLARTEEIIVSAYRAPLGELESPANTRLLSSEALLQSATVTLDGQLRQVPGVELFRRSS